MDAWKITFTVPGQPVPQPRPKISTWGGRGRAYVEARHPIHAFRQAVQISAGIAARQARHKASGEPMLVEILCVFGRPPSHLTKNGTPRSTAPLIPPRVDWDNLGKGVCDAITDSGAIWLDDDLVSCGSCRKRYARPGERPGTTITVRRDDDYA